MDKTDRQGASRVEYPDVQFSTAPYQYAQFRDSIAQLPYEEQLSAIEPAPPVQLSPDPANVTCPELMAQISPETSESYGQTEQSSQDENILRNQICERVFRDFRGIRDVACQAWNSATSDLPVGLLEEVLMHSQELTSTQLSSGI